MDFLPFGMSTMRRLLMIASMNGGAETEYTVTGNPVSFQTNVSKPLSRMLIPFAPVQSGSGDPSPENVRPISGITGLTAHHSGEDTSNPTSYPVTFPALGKNLIDDSIRSTATSTTQYIGATNSSYSIFLKAGTYTISCDFNNVPYGMFCREQNDSSYTVLWNSGAGTYSKTFTLSSDGLYRFWVYRNEQSGGIDASNIKTVMLAEGSFVVSYEPYTNTAYGGELDLVNCILTIGWKMVTVGDYDWEYTANYQRFRATIPDIAETGKARNTKMYCSTFLPIYDERAIGDVPDYSIYSGGTDAHYIYIHDSDYSTGADFKTAFSSTQFAYPLKTPIVIELTQQQVIQTLIGDNVIWTDTNGENTITYLKKG